MQDSNDSSGNEQSRVSQTPDPRAAALAELAKRHATWLRSVCQTLARNAAEADELVEETFQVAVAEIDPEGGEVPVEVALMQIAKRLSERHSVVPQAKSQAQAPKAAPQGTTQPKADKRAWDGSKALGWALASATALAIITAVVWSQEHASDNGSAIPFGAFGRVSQISRASTQIGGASGLTVQEGSSAPHAVNAGTALTEECVLRTDGRTRARVDLRDGSYLVLNHNTELALSPAHVRQMELRQGEIVADIAHVEGDDRATISTPAGEIEVLGTQFVLATNSDMANVRVVRGSVSARSGGGQANVKAGEEGVLVKTRAPAVSPSVGLAAAMAWSDMTPDRSEPDAPIPGLGELRAKRPGERGEGDHPLRLVTHEVDVNIQGALARTDVVEVFRNDTDHTLEGIYRFPLPPDASIAGLSLDVDGTMQSGVFVDSQEASRIWNGVIRHATANPVNRPHEEWVWVPGPWRDPALLQWQRGGRFELRIFPIPAHGERRIAIHYTQVVNAHADRRSYTYPLPHGASASMRAEHFKLDAHIGGAREVIVGGYDVHAERHSDAFEMHFAADSFEPVGDLVLDYALADDATELRTYAYRPPSTTSADTAGFAAFALRPRLPASRESQARDYAIVVDSSQSMFGERYARATNLATRLIANLDRTDRVVVLACDTRCATLSDEPAYASAELATRATDFLRARRPAGASDLVGALSRAANALRVPDGAAPRAAHVLYVGDGVSTIGERRVGSISSEVDAIARTRHVAFSTVGIGGDSDPLVLSELARVGGGHYVPYVPGERVANAALAVLESTYGSTLRSAQIEWPACIRDVSPSTLPNLRAGEEVIVTARIDCDVNAQVTLRGKVGGEEFIQHYPIQVHAGSNEGNAFVPRLWARAKIAELERHDRNEDRAAIIALSKDYFVMSRHTSLLVLESEAMFRAFGVDRAQNQFEWTGGEETESSDSAGTETVNEAPQDLVALPGLMGGLRGDAQGSVGGYRGSRSPGSGGGSSPSGERNRASPTRRSGSFDDALSGLDFSQAPATSTPAPARPEQNAGSVVADQAMPPPVATVERESELLARQQTTIRRPDNSGRWMRRVWRTVREGNVSTNAQPTANDLRALAVSEDALRAAPDARDRYRNAARAAARAGDLDRARSLAETWLGRDALDAEALTYLADSVGRTGSRDESLRLLTGIVDLRPDDRVLQERLFAAFRRADDTEQACAFRIALDEIDRVVNTSSRQSRCSDLRSRGLEPSSGELRVDASWSAPVDLDISLITPQGTRISWMGGRTQVFGMDAHADGRETLGLRRATAGSYIIEITRTDAGTRDDAQGKGHVDEVRGSVTVNVLGQRQTIPFHLTGDHTVVGRADVVVRRYQELVRF
ncbi:MAG: FecR domain-containing protein [Sandaracinaceae bacterium]|nr:FecR domain-containing protein [Sandaracinaceae bacterium]